MRNKKLTLLTNMILLAGCAVDADNNNLKRDTLLETSAPKEWTSVNTSNKNVQTGWLESFNLSLIHI